MTPSMRHRISISMGMVLLLIILAACGQTAGTGGQTSTPGTTATSTSTPPVRGSTPPTAATTVPMPTTQTSCPAAGTGRAAVMAPLALGQHANLVYTFITNSGNTPVSTGLKRYDATTGKAFVVLTEANTIITEAQVSADGQWIMFVAVAHQQAKLQLVRMDGQGLQTLYCTPAPDGANPGSQLGHVQWSTDQKHVLFTSFPTSGGTTYLLTLQSGNVVKEFIGPQGSVAFFTINWLDNTRAYIRGLNADAPSFTIYLLDTSKGPNQHFSNLKLIYDASSGCSCGDFDSSYDGTKAYITSYTTDPNPNGPGIGAVHGPSTISVRPATGGTANTVYTSQNMAITSIRAISPSTLLLIVENSGTGADTSHNGLWKISTNGSGLTQLSSDGGGVSAGPSSLNSFTQYPWSNVSRDGSLYALFHSSADGKTLTLYYGSMNGGTPTIIASNSSATSLAVVGWTTV